MDNKDHSNAQACSASSSEAGEGRAGDSKLAQGIWRRYGDSPGVIPMAGTLQLARRITRLSTERLPLLADVQQRWATTDSSYPDNWPVLRQPAAFTDTPALLPYPARPTSPASGRTNLQRTVSSRVVEAAGTAQISSGVRPASTIPGRGGDLKADLEPPPGPPPEVIQPAAASSGDLGPAILQRREASPRAAQREREVRANIRQGANPPSPTDEDVAPPGPAPGTRWPAPQAAAAAPLAAILQRQVAPPEPLHSQGQIAGSLSNGVGPPASPGEDVTPPGLALGARQPVVKALAATPVATSSGELGTAILQRYLDDPAGQVMRPVFASSEVRRPSEHSPSTARDVAVGLQSDQVERTLPPAGGIGQSAPEGGTEVPATSIGPDIGTAILQRYLNSPARPVILQRFAAPEPRRLAGRRSTEDRQEPPPPSMTGVAQHVAEAEAWGAAATGRGEPGSPSLLRHLDGSPGQGIAYRVPSLQQRLWDEGTPMPPPVMHLPEAGEPEGKAVSATAHPSAASVRVGPEMLLAKAADRGIQREWTQSPMLHQARPTDGYRHGMPLIKPVSSGQPPSVQTRQEAASNSWTSGPTTSTDTVTDSRTAAAIAPEPGADRETDLDDLVEKVLRKLMRQLAIEGERRGWQQWP